LSAVASDNNINNIPFFYQNAVATLTTTTSKTSCNLPKTLTEQQFFSLLEAAKVQNTIADDWTFKLSVSLNENSGYSIDNCDLISPLNNTNLTDNLFYMKNYVASNHSINFGSSSVTIIPDNTILTLNSNSTYLSTANSIMVDLTKGEKLSSDLAGVDGQIRINSNTAITRTTDTASLQKGSTNWANITPYVWYTGENGINNKAAISDDETATNSAIIYANNLKTNPYLKLSIQKLATRTNSTSLTGIKQVNGAILTASSTIDANKCALTYSSNSIDNTIWKLSKTITLDFSSSKLYDKNTPNTYLSNVLSNGYITNTTYDVTQITSGNSYQLELAAKKLNNLDLYRAVNDSSLSNKWSISYTNGVDTCLKATSDFAYSVTNRLPQYSDSLMSLLFQDNSKRIYYKYTYSTIQSGTTYSSLADQISVTYSTSQDYSNGTNFIIDQNNMTKTFTENPQPSISFVDETQYTLNYSSKYKNTDWRLVFVLLNSTFNVSFPALYGAYSNITLNINGLSQTDSYYTLQNKSTLKLAPRSSLQLVALKSTFVPRPNGPQINNIFEAFN
jgi:hypothetical protein